MDRVTSTCAGGLVIAVNSDLISSVEDKLSQDNTELLRIKVNIVGWKTHM